MRRSYQQLAAQLDTVGYRGEEHAFNRLLGHAIKMRREALKIEQQDLARKLGVSQSMLSRIETGRQAVTLYRLVQIAVTLKTTAIELMP